MLQMQYHIASEAIICSENIVLRAWFVEEMVRMTQKNLTKVLDLLHTRYGLHDKIQITSP